MRENVTPGARPLAPALTSGALHHPASFLPGSPSSSWRSRGGGGGGQGDSYHLGGRGLFQLEV